MRKATIQLTYSQIIWWLILLAFLAWAIIWITGLDEKIKTIATGFLG